MGRLNPLTAVRFSYNLSSFGWQKIEVSEMLEPIDCCSSGRNPRLLTN
jgi:hypothetical protein